MTRFDGELSLWTSPLEALALTTLDTTVLPEELERPRCLIPSSMASLWMIFLSFEAGARTSNSHVEHER